MLTMNRNTNALAAGMICLSLFLATFSPGIAAELTDTDWPWWRGPNSNGIAADGQRPPTTWSAEVNVVWRADVPGRGHSSPIVVGQRVLLTTADESAGVQSVVCFDRKTGRQFWTTDVNEGGLPKEIHNKNTHASPTLACDGERVFATFHNHDSVQLAALDLTGEVLWQKKAALFVPKQYVYGYAPSPLVYKQTVIVASDFPGEGSSLAAFDVATSREVWRTDRPMNTSYSSPIVGNVAGREQLLMSGANRVNSYDPATGKALWECIGSADATCGTLVWDDNVVFASGGFPQRETLAVRADGSAKVVWQVKQKCYESSLLAHDGHIYGVNTTGIVFCWQADTGEEKWKVRLGGAFSASPILAGGNIYLSNEKGVTYVFPPDPGEFRLLAKNELGEESFATPTIVASQIFLRVAAGDGDARRETLYCIGE